MEGQQAGQEEHQGNHMEQQVAGEAQPGYKERSVTEADDIKTGEGWIRRKATEISTWGYALSDI